ncbi:HAAS signaling domain-containing protein [Glycomyces paridis]|uniref:Uncharacterized protein n=1 Tax=Glycomyces paridis TaxID=2126555 RepID=A0A4S8PT98_9ACTN|nr:hypothetical protein [Glycomyces paridis]THV31324.1 hypothetical protein E9998_02850 [Glycomyces paridis]
MTDATSRTTEIAGYLAAVERHLGDLPEAIRQDLMSDLDAHLAEVAADLDDGVALRDLLGSPEAYARELRETAEVPRERAAARLRRGLRETAAPLTRRVKTWSDRYAVSTGHADAAELVERLRPGWWVARGVIAAMLVVYILSATQYNTYGSLPFDSLSWLLFTAAAVLFFVWVSLRLGRRSQTWGRRRRWWTGAAGIALVVYALYGFAWPYALNYGGNDFVETSYYDETSHITDIQVFDENGEPIDGVYLFDQNGDPLMLGDSWSCFEAEDQYEDPYAQDRFEAEQESRAAATGFPETGLPGAEPDPELGYLYPICDTPAEDPTEGPSEEPTATEDPTPSASEETPTDAEPTEAPTETAGPDGE